MTEPRTGRALRGAHATLWNAVRVRFAEKRPQGRRLVVVPPVEPFTDRKGAQAPMATPAGVGATPSSGQCVAKPLHGVYDDV